MQLGEALLHALKAHGAREIFGIPGDFALPFFKVIEDSGILPLYTFSHEPAVGFAADAAARANCAMGVAAVTYGAGAFNLVNAIAGAGAERSPVVVISGAPGRAECGSGLLLHHQAKSLDSQYRVYREITCDQARLDDPERAPIEIARVLKSAREQSMPVYLELPRDMVSVDCAPVRHAKPSAIADAALAECAAEILGRLQIASSPVLMAGVEIRRYGIEDKVAELARRLGLPIVTSFMGRGLLAQSGAPLLGTYLGVAGQPEITDLVERSDGLLLLGVILSDTNFGISHRQIDMRRAIQALGREVRIGYHVYPDIPLDALVDALLGCTAAASARPSRRTPPPDRLRARLGRRRCTDRAQRHRVRGQRRDGAARADANGGRRGRLPVRCHGDRAYQARRVRVLCRHGVWRAGRARYPGDHRRAAADSGRRRRLSDDRLGARELPPLRLGSHRAGAEQHELGNAAHFPAGVPLQRSGRLALRGDRSAVGRARRARDDPGRAQGGARARCVGIRPIQPYRDHAGARRHIGDALPIPARFPAAQRGEAPLSADFGVMAAMRVA